MRVALLFLAACSAQIGSTPPSTEAPDAGIPSTGNPDAPVPDAPGPTAPPLDSRGVISIAGHPIFPIILSLPPPDAAGIATVTAAGVNVLKTGPGTTWNDSTLGEVKALNALAAANGAYTWVNLLQLARAQPGSPDEQTLRDVVTALRDDPGLGMYKGADEPWWGNLSADSLANAYQVTQSIDPQHLWTLIEAPRGTSSDLAPYSAVTDLHGVDIYPVGYGITNPDLHQVGTWTHTIASVTPDHGIIMTLQICWSGADDPAGSGAFVTATHRQERYMIYDAIINGARGLSFFGGTVALCWNASDAAAGWNWTYWNNVLADLVRELHGDLYPALLAPGTGLGLVTDDSTTQVLSRRVGNDIWVIAARRGTGTQTVTISNLPIDLTTGDVYTEGRTISASNGSLTDTFGQWAVHVYHFTSNG